MIDTIEKLELCGVVLTDDKKYIVKCSDPSLIEGMVVIPESILGFSSSGAFCNCAKLTHVQIPSTFSRIGYESFSGCTSLISVLLPESITSVDACAFEKCEALEYIRFPQKLRTIGYSAFRGCKSLKEISVPDTVYSIDSLAFNNCVRLSSVRIPKCDIKLSAFSGCVSVKAVEISSCVDILKSKNMVFTHFYDAKSLSTIRIKNVVYSVDEIFREMESQLSAMSMLYNGFKMNLTKVRGHEELKTFKDFDQSWPYKLEDFSNSQQKKSFILSQNWYRNSGIGLVLNWNDYHAIDVDGVLLGDDPNFGYRGVPMNELIAGMLDGLGLPDDYPWVVKSGSKRGFHIIFKAKFSDGIVSTSSYNANSSNSFWLDNDLCPVGMFNRLELRWDNHLILPPSIHSSGYKYEFWKDVPDYCPSEISLKNIDDLIFRYCGRAVVKSYKWKDCNFKLAEFKKCSSRIQSGVDFIVEPKEDSLLWLEQSDSPYSKNSLAIRYLLGVGVGKNKKLARYYFELSDSDLAHFNLASLLACGYLEGDICSVEEHISAIQDFSIFSCDDLGELLDQIRTNAAKQQSNVILDNRCNIIFIDTETTGLPNTFDYQSLDINEFPRIVQVSWIIANSENDVIAKKNFIVKPNGFTIPTSSTQIHGITNELANNSGVDIVTVVNELIKDICISDLIVGHNIEFDVNVINAEVVRLGINFNIFDKPMFCTMVETVNVCKIPGYNGFKYPKLQELYYYLFGNNFSGEHSSEADVTATMSCYFELEKRGLLLPF